MDQLARVKGYEGGESTQGRERHGLRRGKGAAPQALREGLTLEQLHRDVKRTLVLADLVELTNVRMVDRGGGASLPPEAAHRGLVGELLARSP